jgi:hypothetical protein
MSQPPLPASRHRLKTSSTSDSTDAPTEHDPRTQRPRQYQPSADFSLIPLSLLLDQLRHLGVFLPVFRPCRFDLLEVHRIGPVAQISQNANEVTAVDGDIESDFLFDAAREDAIFGDRQNDAHWPHSPGLLPCGHGNLPHGSQAAYGQCSDSGVPHRKQ